MEDTQNLVREDRMPFDSSICVRVGDNTNREVKSVHGASEVMIDWPHARRGPVYQSTMEVLEAARSGRASADGGAERLPGLRQARRRVRRRLNHTPAQDRERNRTVHISGRPGPAPDPFPGPEPEPIPPQPTPPPGPIPVPPVR